MIPIIYLFLLLTTSVILYKSGKLCLYYSNKFNYYALLGIIAFTLNVGLRWGRGLDYNYYFYAYNDIVRGFDTGHEYLFQLIIRIFGSLGITWQGFVMFMSFILIVSVFVFLKNYPKVLPIALALFPFFSISAENLMRWYFGFSFILCGIGILVSKRERSILYFIILSVIGVNLHYGLLPLPLIFYCVWKFDRVFLNPWISISIFISLVLLFESNFMLKFVSIINNLSLGERFSGYQSNIEYWLTGGYAGGSRSVFSNKSITLLYIMLTIWGYKISKIEDKSYKYIFNLYIIGFVSYPICCQIELLDRYNQLFLIFQFIILAYVITNLYRVQIKIGIVPKILTFLIFLTWLINL